MGKPISVKVTQKFDAPVEDVFNGWIEPDKVRDWMSAALKSMGLTGEIARVEIDPRIGGRFLFCDMRDGEEFCHWGTYLEFQPPNRLVFTWNTPDSDESDPCNVYLTIAPDGAGSIVTIDNEIDEKWQDYIKETKSGWQSLLQAEERILKEQK